MAVQSIVAKNGGFPGFCVGSLFFYEIPPPYKKLRKKLKIIRSFITILVIFISRAVLELFLCLVFLLSPWHSLLSKLLPIHLKISDLAVLKTLHIPHPKYNDNNGSDITVYAYLIRRDY